MPCRGHAGKQQGWSADRGSEEETRFPQEEMGEAVEAGLG